MVIRNRVTMCELPEFSVPTLNYPVKLRARFVNPVDYETAMKKATNVMTATLQPTIMIAHDCGAI